MCVCVPCTPVQTANTGSVSDSYASQSQSGPVVVYTGSGHSYWLLFDLGDLFFVFLFSLIKALQHDI